VQHGLFLLGDLAAALDFDAGFFFAAVAATPKTDSFNAFGREAQPRTRRSFDLLAGGGIAPEAGRQLALAKMPIPASRIVPSFLSSRSTSVLSSLSANFASF
jgi:hypothetical protein